MAAAATVLLDWQPVVLLERENYQLRVENRHLHGQVHELMRWKERALRHLAAMGPQRTRARREGEQATRMQRKLLAVEQTLQERVALTASRDALATEVATLTQERATCEEEAVALRETVASLRTQRDEQETQMQSLVDAFRAHLEALVAIREQVEEEHDEDGDGHGDGHDDGDDDSKKAIGTDAVAKKEDTGVCTGAESLLAATAGVDEKAQHKMNDPAVVITGLGAVSDKCLRWFRQHVAQSLARIQAKAALYEAQHAELDQLRVQAQHARLSQVESAAQEMQRVQEVTRLQHANAELTDALSRLQMQREAQAQGRTQTGDHVRLLVTEVRHYLRLVRAEIKKKFGYVPVAITHADNWARILDAMDLLERQLRISTSSAP